MEIKKVGIDVRKFSRTKKAFCKEFLEFFISKNQDIQINIYGDTIIENYSDNVKFNDYPDTFFQEQLFFYKQLLKDKNDFIISFESTFPLLYLGKIIQIFPTLDFLIYPELNDSKIVKKNTASFTTKRRLKLAREIICFNSKTKEELNEKFNLPESKIQIIDGYFPILKKFDNTFIKDIGIKGDFLIFDYDYEISNNLDRLLEALKEINTKIDVSLVIIGNKNSSDIDLRQKVIDLGLNNKIHFVGELNEEELYSYYKQANGVIYPIVYENFPFSLYRAISYDVQLLASNNEDIKNIFGQKIIYFNPTYMTSMVSTIENFITSGKNTKIDYNDIRSYYNIDRFYIDLLKIISKNV